MGNKKMKRACKGNSYNPIQEELQILACGLSLAIEADKIKIL